VAPNVKIWKPPFRKEFYYGHRLDQHPLAWETFQKLSVNDKKSFFDNRVEKKNTIGSHLGSTGSHLLFKIKSFVVDNIIADLFFHEGDKRNSTSKTCAMKLFKVQDDGSYVVTIKNPVRFQLAVDHVFVGLSFCQTASVICQTYTRIKDPKLRGLSDTMVSQFARIVVALNLETLSKLLDDSSIWAFSLASGSSQHRGCSFFDQRL